MTSENALAIEQPVRPIDLLVRHFGGQTKTAKALDVSQPAVSQWLSGACQMSPANAFVAEERCGGVVKAWELCNQIPRPAQQLVS